MSETKIHGEVTGIGLLQFRMSNWRSQLDIEYKRWREGDEQAYKQIEEIIKEHERVSILNKTMHLESTSDPPDLEEE